MADIKDIAEWTQSALTSYFSTFFRTLRHPRIEFPAIQSGDADAKGSKIEFDPKLTAYLITSILLGLLIQSISIGIRLDGSIFQYTIVVLLCWCLLALVVAFVIRLFYKSTLNFHTLLSGVLQLLGTLYVASNILAYIISSAMALMMVNPLSNTTVYLCTHCVLFVGYLFVAFTVWELRQPVQLKDASLSPLGQRLVRTGQIAYGLAIAAVVIAVCVRLLGAVYLYQRRREFFAIYRPIERTAEDNNCVNRSDESWNQLAYRHHSVSLVIMRHNIEYRSAPFMEDNFYGSRLHRRESVESV